MVVSFKTNTIYKACDSYSSKLMRNKERLHVELKFLRENSYNLEES